MYHIDVKARDIRDILRGLARVMLLQRFGDYRSTVAAGIIGILLLLLPFYNAGRNDSGIALLQFGAILAVIPACLIGKHQLPRSLSALCIAITIWMFANAAWAISLSSVLGALLPSLSIILVFWALLCIGTNKTATTVVMSGLFIGLLYSGYIIWHQLQVPLASPAHWLDPQFRQAIPYRYAGPMDNPNVFAGYIAMVLPLSLAAAMRSPRWFALAGIASTAVGIAALILSYSRAGWLAGLVGLLIVVVAGIRFTPKRCGIVILGLLVSTSLFILFAKPALFQRCQGIISTTQGTVQHRLFMWKTGFSMLRSNPLTGVGLGCYEAAFALYRPKGIQKTYALITEPGSAHSDWVQWCAETGIIGVVLLLLGIFTMIRARLQACQKHEDRPGKLLCWGASGSLVAWAIGGTGQSYLAYPLCAVLFCVASAWLFTDGTNPSRYSGFSAKSQKIIIVSLVVFLGISTSLSTYSRLLRERGEGELYANNTQRALEYIHQSHKWNPFDTTTLGMGGDIYADLAWEQHDVGEEPRLWLTHANDWYQQCVEGEPTNGNWYCRLADTQERQGNISGALSSYQHAIKNDWYRASYHLQAGRLANKLSHKNEAKLHFEQAVTLFPVWIELSRQRTGKNSTDTQTYVNAYDDAKTQLDELSTANKGGPDYVSANLHTISPSPDYS